MTTITNNTVKHKLTILNRYGTKLDLVEILGLWISAKTDTKSSEIDGTAFANLLGKLLFADELENEILLVGRETADIEITFPVFTGKIPVGGILQAANKKIIGRSTMLKIISHKACVKIITHTFVRHNLNE